jgi:hypothetical protein
MAGRLFRFIIEFLQLRQVPHGRSKTKNIAFEAQHAPQPRFADGCVVSGMPKLR